MITATPQTTPRMISLAMRRQAIEHIIASCKGIDPTILQAAQEGVRVLLWLERRQAAMKAVANLEQEQPAVLSLLTEFPGSRVDLRSIGL